VATAAENCLNICAQSVFFFCGILGNTEGARTLTRRSQRPLFWAITIGCPKNANGFQKTAIVWSLITKLNIPGSSEGNPTPAKSSMSCVLGLHHPAPDGASTLLL
jgi:hypothetical protein